MSEMTPQRWERTATYLHEVFGQEDERLRKLRQEAEKDGFPDIAITPEVGRLLMMLTAATSGRVALEIGTLWGYSAMWICRGLAATGRLVTVECDPCHAEFAEEHFRRFGLSDRVQVRRGAALEVLPEIASELGEEAVDFAFIDADKREYADYWKQVRPLIAPGGFVVVDNALGSGSWWIDDIGHPLREQVDEMNRMVASDSDFESVAVPLRQGLLIARRMG